MTISADAQYLLNHFGSVGFKTALGDLLKALESVPASEIALADGSVLIGDSGGLAAAQTLSGDVTTTRAGVMSIGAKKVLTAMINDLAVDAGQIAANAVVLAKIAVAARPIYHVVGMGTFTTAGGDANESITVTGCLGTDTALVWVQKAGASAKTVDSYTPGTGSIAVVMSADPSTDHKLGWIVVRAAA